MKKQKQKSDFKHLRELVSHQYLYKLGIGLTIVTTLIFVGLPIVLKKLIDDALSQDTDQFYSLFIITSVISLIILIMHFVSSLILGKYANMVLKEVLAKQFYRIKEMSNEQLSNTQIKQIITHTPNELEKLGDFIQGTLPKVIHVLIVLFGSIILFFILSWKLALISGVWVILLIWIKSMLNKWLTKAKKQVSEESNELKEVMEILTSDVTSSKMFVKQNHKLLQSKRRLELQKACTDICHQVLNIGLFLVIIMFGVYFQLNQNLTYGALIAFTQLVIYFTVSIKEVPSLFPNMLGQLGSASKVLEALALEYPQTEQEGE